MQNLTRTLLALLAAGLVSGAFSTHEAQAAHITGTIDFAGAAMFDSSHLDNVTQVMVWRDVFGNAGFSNVAATMGDFLGIPLGTQAMMATPWIFTPPRILRVSGVLVGSRSIS